MNRQGKGKIEWCDWSWSPITGCLRGCSWCYARRMAYRLRGRVGYSANDPFAPTFHPDRLLEPTLIKKPARIFVGSMGEMFAPYVPDDWVNEVLRVVGKCPQHIFIFLTKNPGQLKLWNPWPKNVWVGASATDREMAWTAWRNLQYVDASVRYLSCEPLLESFNKGGYRGFPDIMMSSLHWLIIGAMTGTMAKRHQPQREWVGELVRAADKARVPVFLKNNLLVAFPNLVLRQEFPHA